MLQRLGSPTRRGLVACAAAVGIALGASACSTLAQAQSAAIVNGHEITVSELAETTQQYNQFLNTGKKLSEADVLGGLLLARFAVPAGESTAGWKPDSTYTGLLAKVPNASPETTELIKLVSIGQAGLLQGGTPTIDRAMADAKKAKIEVDPRYGVFSASELTLGTPAPNWIKPVPAGQDPGPAPTPAQ